MQLLPPWLDVSRGITHPAFLWVLQKPLSCSRAVWAQTVSPAGAAVTLAPRSAGPLRSELLTAGTPCTPGGPGLWSHPSVEAGQTQGAGRCDCRVRRWAQEREYICTPPLVGGPCARAPACLCAGPRALALVSVGGVSARLDLTGAPLSLSQIHVTEQAHRGAGAHVLGGAAVLQPRPGTQRPHPLLCVGPAGWERPGGGLQAVLGPDPAGPVCSRRGALSEVLRVQLGSRSFRPCCQVSSVLGAVFLA